jgi:hypothetical protein
MVVQPCVPSYSRGRRSRRVIIQGWPRESRRPYQKNKLKAKGLEGWLKW